MDFNKFKDKLIRRLTSPVEFLYVVTSHWFLLLCMVCAGTFAMFIYVIDQPPYYEAYTTLILNPNEPVFEDNIRQRNPYGNPNFIKNQVGILRSDTVITTLIRSLPYNYVSSSEDTTPDSKEKRNYFSGVFRDIKKKFNDLKKKITPKPAGPLDEQRTQKAVRTFRIRSDVVAIKGSNELRLQVIGTNRERIQIEVDQWVKAYRKRIDDLTEETYKRYLLSQKEHWDGYIENAKDKIDKFLKDNPDANSTTQKLVQENGLKQQLHIEKLRAQLARLTTAGPNPPPTVIEPEEPEDENESNLLATLESRLRELEVQKAEYSGRYPPRSKIIGNINKSIESVKQRIELLQEPFPEKKLDEKKDFSMVAILERSILEAESDMQEIFRQQVAINNKLSELQYLKDDLLYGRDKLKRIEEMVDWSMAVTEGRKIVQVHADNPRAGTSPINQYKFFKVGVGSLAGAIMGFFLAFMREFFCQKIRFKKDVQDDLGLEVVGIVPEN